MKGIYVGTNGVIAVVEDNLNYDQLCSLVGGMLENVITLDGQYGFANETGLIDGLPINTSASYMCGHGIAGDVVLLSVDSEGNSASVDDSYIAKLRKVWTVEPVNYTVNDVIEARQSCYM